MNKYLWISLILNFLLVGALAFVIFDKKAIEETLTHEIQRCNPSYFEKS